MSLQFYVFLNHVLYKIGRIPGELTGKTLIIFQKINGDQPMAWGRLPPSYGVIHP
jgi:hypothetical protein